ncbi:MAG: thioredoxin family protein [Armatimonadota bacterium]|nr:thioredoxin family protein [Armatimonadota bacterium]MDR7426670.1 thioredoxin family protein [Armatimonadota bacterium]MDR7464377.1 thioredoxin family protein [Armatimonadota bacterium]MDR7469221.1 thioredoxin family protein [Armatimonadota bacterium]MDR7475068.1 thioredoxin family protein [Armatimonadota bacterium]
MSERLVVLVSVLLLLGLAGLWLAARPRRLSARLARNGPSPLPPGRPLVLAFTSPDCAACQAAQRPALAELAARLGDGVQIREVDVLADRETARAFGVFSVPTTAVLDAAGRVVALNIGFASADRLLEQLSAVRAHEDR